MLVVPVNPIFFNEDSMNLPTKHDGFVLVFSL